ncbi:MAG: beta-ketoacyl synthase [Bacteroidales bacterium]|jgi:3-oxoacyl-[acyl-carrier-protein] synthase-1|nr:beta-ketoacyl synthase [Bacteroidales bacterium]
MYIIGDNIISSLGFTTEENYTAAKQGVSEIKHYDAGIFGLPEPFMASLIDKERLNDTFAAISSDTHYTNLEKATILSVFYANKEAQIDLSNPKTLFILSSTKGNVDILDMRYETSYNLKSLYLWHTAELIAGFFGNKNTPVVVSNACISGAAAQIVAKRELDFGKYDNVVVVGVDFLSKFIISGFQSFKALSPELCRPFDKNRCGLNLGEAAATLIMAKCRDMVSRVSTPKNYFRFVSGAVRNDATHISAPSRTGEGSFRAINAILNSQLPTLKSQIAFINAHGTATPYNDAMEMNAIVRAGLQDIPVNALKSCFGHTLGAAGIVETIISIYALNEGLILKTLGFEESEKIEIDDEEFTLDVCNENRKTDKNYFIKIMSGFGGVNVALLLCKE